MTRATMQGGAIIALIYAVVSTIVIWMWVKLVGSPEALTMPLQLALGLGLGGAIFEGVFPTTRTFGFWEVLGESVGYTIALLILCTAPAIEFIYAFVALAVLVRIGQFLRVWRLKKRGYTVASN